MNKDKSDLENRVAALEGLSQERQKQWNRVVDEWSAVLLEFCETYGLKIPDALRGTESRT